MTKSLGVTVADFATKASPFQTFQIPNHYLTATVPVPTVDSEIAPDLMPLARVLYASPAMPKAERSGNTDGFFDWAKQTNSRQIAVINHRLTWAKHPLAGDGQTQNPYEMAVVFTDGAERLTVWMAFNDQYCPEVSLMDYLFINHAPSGHILETLRVWARFQPSAYLGVWAMIDPWAEETAIPTMDWAAS